MFSVSQFSENFVDSGGRLIQDLSNQMTMTAAC